MTYMTIPSTISGGPSIFQVRMGTGEILSAGDHADFLVAFYQHSYDAHINSLRPGGVLVYDSDHVNPDPADKRFTAVGIPITGRTVEAVGGASKDKGKNIFVLGLLARSFNLDVEKLRTLVTERFGGREDIVRNAMLAFDAGYAMPVENLLGHCYRFDHKPRVTGQRLQVTMDGNTALTYGLLAARRYVAWVIPSPHGPRSWKRSAPSCRNTVASSCRRRTNSPRCRRPWAFPTPAISPSPAVPAPASRSRWRRSAGQSWPRCRSSLSTCSAAGPAPACRTNEQSDLLQAIYGSHGDAPRVVLAPRDVEDCFYIALEAGRIARDYSTPVLILSDFALATRIEALEEPDLKNPRPTRSPDFPGRGADYKPYPLERATRHAPPGSRMDSGIYPVVTGLEHDEMGHPTGNPELHTKMTAKRREKIKRLAATLPVPEVYGETKGEVLVVGWGSTFGPIRDAVKTLRAAGEKAGQVHLRNLHPLPPGLEEIFHGYRHICVVEMNDEGLYGHGQLATLLRARYANPAIRSITKTDGLTFKVREIVDGIKHLQTTAGSNGKKPI